MKRVLIILLGWALILTLSPARADSLAEIKAQAQAPSARWQLPILLPQGDKAPVLRMKPGSRTPHLSEPLAEYSQAVPGAYGVARNDPQWQGFGAPGMRPNLPGGLDFSIRKQDGPWDLSRVYPENNPLSLGEALAFVQQHALSATGMDFDLFSLVIANSGKKGRATLMGFEILPPYGQGFYQLELRQVTGGWMLMDAVTSQLSEHYRGSRPAWHFRPSEARIASPDSYNNGISCWEVDQALAEDLPLCPLEKVLNTYATLTERGLIRRPSELRLGHVLFMDEGRPGSAIAFPCWLMKAEYSDKPGRQTSAAFADLSVEHSPHYRQILVNARTGELIGPDIMKEADSLAPEY